MCYTVLPKSKVQKLCIAAQAVQQLLDDGTLAAAFVNTDDGAVHKAAAGFDVLAARVDDVLAEQKIVSPFLRYRPEILGHYETAGRLRALVMNLWGGRPVNLSLLFQQADARHTCIALECIASYTHYGENDTFFMTLAAEIIDREAEEVAA